MGIANLSFKKINKQISKNPRNYPHPKQTPTNQATYIELEQMNY